MIPYANPLSGKCVLGVGKPEPELKKFGSVHFFGFRFGFLILKKPNIEISNQTIQFGSGFLNFRKAEPNRSYHSRPSLL